MTKSFVKISYYIVSMAMIIASAMMFASVSEAAGIANSAHDFSINSTGSKFSQQFYIGNDGITEICVFCHTPHSASTDAQTNTLLWNRINPVASQTYIPYTTSSGSIMPDGTGKPTGISLMCMSCHDGVTSIAVGTLINAPGSGSPTVILDPFGTDPPSAISDVINGNAPWGWGANIGNTLPGGTNINMSNDHPISFDWQSAKQGYIYPPTRSELRLFGATTRLECATCHSVHDPTNFPFLSMPNTNSDMCRACHDK